MKIHQDNAGHLTKMADMPIYIKNTLEFSLQDHWTDFDETLHEAT